MRKGIVIVPSDFKDFDWVERLKSLQLNTLGLHSGGGEAHNTLNRLAFTITDEFLDTVTAAGLDYEYELHAPADLMPPSLASSHPEYFALDEHGNRHPGESNWCFSTNGVLETVAENAEFLAKKLHSSTNRYFFWGEDRPSGTWCRCPKCAPFTESDQNLITANAIATRLRQTMPEATVACLCYHGTFEAPRNVKPAPGVFLEYAPYNRDYTHALDDPASEVNHKHMQILLELLKVFPPETAHILEYWLDASKYGYTGPVQKPIFVPEVVKRDLAFYHSLGIRSITTFAVRMDGDYFKQYGDKELNMYAEFINNLQ